MSLCSATIFPLFWLRNANLACKCDAQEHQWILNYFVSLLHFYLSACGRLILTNHRISLSTLSVDCDNDWVENVVPIFSYVKTSFPSIWIVVRLVTAPPLPWAPPIAHPRLESYQPVPFMGSKKFACAVSYVQLSGLANGRKYSTRRRRTIWFDD